MSRVDEQRVRERERGSDMAARGEARGLRRVLVDRRVLAVLVVALALVPLVVSIVRVLVDHRFALHGDDALIELRVRDVGGSHTPLVGSYQRYGFNQPGPLLLYLYTVPYRVLGSTFAGIQVGGLLLAAGSVVAIGVVAWRRGRTGLLLWSLVLALVLARYVPSQLADPWEPYALVLPLAALAFLAFDVAAGDPWALPAVIGFATLSAQAYTVTAPVSIALAVFAVVAAIVRARRERDGRAWRRPLAVAAAVLVVLWIPPAIDALVHHPSNVRRAWDFFSGNHATLGLADGYRVVATQLGVPAPWGGGSVVRAVFTSTLDLAAAPAVPIALLVAAVGVVLAARRRSRSAWFGLVAVISFAAGALAMSRLVGPVFVWIPQWTRMVGMACWAAGGWCLFESLPTRVRDRLARPLVATLAVGLVVLVVANSVVAVTARRPADPLQQAVLRLSSAAAPTARAAHGPVLVRSQVDVDTAIGGSEVGVEVMALALERRGIHVVVQRDFANRLGAFRARPALGREELLIVSASAPVPAGYRLVASADPLTHRQRADRERIPSELSRILPGATLHQIHARMRTDERFRSLVERLQQIPDLPPLALVARPRRPS